MQNQKGAILYFTIVIMSVLLAAVFSIGSVILVQIKSIREAGDSVIAFYAADTGIETALNDLYNPAGISIQIGGEYNELLDGADYNYEVFVTQPLGGTLQDINGNLLPEEPLCGGTYYCIKSTGNYYNVKRAIEVKG